MSTKQQTTLAGLLIFLASIVIFMGIITAEAFYPHGYSTRNSPICGLGGTKPPNSIIMQPSATIFNTAMIISGVLYLASALLMHFAFKKHIITVFLGLIGIGSLGVGLFPCPSWTLHYSSSVLLFVSSQILVIILYTFVSAPLRYIFLCFGLASLISDSPIGYQLIAIFGKGGEERLIIYPIIFSLIGFGAYLMGHANHSESQKK